MGKVPYLCQKVYQSGMIIIIWPNKTCLSVLNLLMVTYMYNVHKFYFFQTSKTLKNVPRFHLLGNLLSTNLVHMQLSCGGGGSLLSIMQSNGGPP